MATAHPVPFREVREVLESHGWQFANIVKPYRVFKKPGHLPILVPVHDNEVEPEYVQKIKDILKKSS